MFPGFSTGFAAMLADALSGADVHSFEVERSRSSWRSPVGELVESVRVHVWVYSVSDLRRVRPRLGLGVVEGTSSVAKWGGWVTSDAAAGLPFPVSLEVSCFDVQALDDLTSAADDTIVAAADIEKAG